jgi:hypothetical protein
MAEEIIGIKVTTDAAQATQEVNKLDKAFEGTDTTVKSIRAQIKEANAELIKAQTIYGDYSKEALKAAKTVAGLKDRVQEAKETADLFDPGKRFQALSGTISAVAGGFAAVQGAMALFGKENKQIEEALLKVNAAMALSQGLSTIRDSQKDFERLGSIIKSTTTFQNLSNAATKTATAVQKAFGIATVTTSAGFKVLRGAIIATGIGALVVALGLVIANFDKISKWIKSSPLGALAKGVGNLVKQFTDFIGITSQAERNLNKLSAANKRANEDISNRIKILKAQGGSEKQIYELSKKRIENELNDIRNSLKVKKTLSDEDQKKMRDLKVEQLVLTAEFNKKSADENKKAADEAKKKRDEANKQAIEDKKNADKMLLDLQNQKALAEITSEDDKAKKQAEINNNARIAEINALKIDIKTKNELKNASEATYQLELKAIDDKIKEDKLQKDKKFEEDLQATLSEARIAAFKEGKEKEIAALDEKMLEETKKILNNADYTEQQKGLLVAALRSKYGADVAAIDSKFLKEANDKEFERFKDITNNENLSFSARKKGVDDALALNRKLFKEGKIDSVAYTKTEKELSEGRIELSKKEASSRAENAQKISSTLKNVAKAIGEHTVAGKAAAVAAVTIDTYMSATAAFKSLAGIPVVGPVLGGIAAAAAVAAGLKNVKSILAVKTPAIPSGSSEPGFIDIPSPGGGVGSMGSGGSIPTINQIDTPDLSGGGGGGGVDRASGDTIVRAYVVESDITNTQSRMQEIENRARFE